MKDLLALPTTMSSREIATLLDVRHDNVKRTIERQLLALLQRRKPHTKAQVQDLLRYTKLTRGTAIS